MPSPALRRPVLWLVLAILSVAASFVLSSWWVQHQARGIESESLGLTTNALPSVQTLNEAQTQLLMVGLTAGEAAHGRDRTPLVHARARLDNALEAYRVLPDYVGEEELFASLERTLQEMDSDIAQLLASPGRVDPDLYAAFHAQLEAADHALSALLAFNNQHAMEHVARIRLAREQAARETWALDTLSVLLALLAAALVVRVVRRQIRLEADALHQRERADELEQFSARVAHDVLSPLASVGLALSVIERQVRDERLAQATERGQRGLRRVERIVDGLLAFARAGGKPQTRESTWVAPLVEDVLGDLSEQAADAQVVLSASQLPQARVACSAGILTSVLQNLVRNAIRYMGASRERRVDVRAAVDGRWVRLEVEDTGPGLPPGMEQRVFEPYVRGPGTHGSGGLGLGLATVKRVVEAHGGRVLVRSTPGRGAVFTVLLPLAGSSAAPQPDAGAMKLDPSHGGDNAARG